MRVCHVRRAMPISVAVHVSQSSYGAKLRHHAKPLFVIFSIPIGCGKLSFERSYTAYIMHAAASAQT